ncbi:hypothetical protein LCGC14_3041720 [marine sediment metagenome]|uniref:Peptidase M15A C-terminal domain-containing protein n=1 Tax=marine sediment metagenome TaxID=412755 RepID=A0A0F8XCL5_9ZZZZ
MSWPAEGLEFFTREEFDAPDEMDSFTLLFIDEVRRRLGLPIRITSDYRTDEETEAFTRMMRPGRNPHPRRTALDWKPVPFTMHTRILCLGIVGTMYKEGLCPRIGLEIADKHFHTDTDAILKRPWLWFGRSR